MLKQERERLFYQRNKKVTKPTKPRKRMTKKMHRNKEKNTLILVVIHIAPFSSNSDSNSNTKTVKQTKKKDYEKRHIADCIAPVYTTHKSVTQLP